MRSNSGSGRRPTDAARGRPDERFPRAPAAPTAPSAEPGEEILVSVVDSVNTTRNEGEIRFVNPVPGGRPSGIGPQGSARLRVKNESGKVLNEYPVLVKIYTDMAPEDEREGLVDAVIPVSPAARTIELVIAGRVAAERRVGGAPPAVRAVQRVAADEKEADLLLALDRQLDEGHTYSVQVSADQGRTWQTVAVGLREPTFAIDRRQFREGQELRVRVIATNGLLSSVVASEPIRP